MILLSAFGKVFRKTIPSGGAIDFVFALIFPKQHQDKPVLLGIEVPRLLLCYTSNHDDHLWSAKVLSLGRYEHQTLEQHFPSMPHSGWRSIVVNKATYKEPAFTIFWEKRTVKCRETAEQLRIIFPA
jgi:hypothetical protein